MHFTKQVLSLFQNCSINRTTADALVTVPSHYDTLPSNIWQNPTEAQLQTAPRPSRAHTLPHQHYQGCALGSPRSSTSTDVKNHGRNDARSFIGLLCDHHNILKVCCTASRLALISLRFQFNCTVPPPSEPIEHFTRLGQV